MKTFLTSCVNSTAELIIDMVDNSTEVTLEELRDECDIENWELEQGYVTDPDEEGLTLEKDYHVTYHKSFFEGEPCYYIKHSCIEYVFV